MTSTVCTLMTSVYDIKVSLPFQIIKSKNSCCLPFTYIRLDFMGEEKENKKEGNNGNLKNNKLTGSCLSYELFSK